MDPIQGDEVVVVDRAKVTGSLTKTAHVTINDLDTLWVTRHYTGLGASLKFMECHVFRRLGESNSFLGSFAFQETPAFDAPWIPAEGRKDLATEKEVLLFRKVRMSLLSLVDKVWL